MSYSSTNGFGTYGGNQEMTVEELYAFILRMTFGTADIEDGAVTNGKIADFAVDYAKIAHASIGEVHIREASINNAMIQNAAISRAKIENAAIGTAQIDSASIIGAHIANLAVDSGNIADLAVTRAKIAELAVDTAKIDDLAVTTAKISDAAITNAKIENAAIDTAKIKDASITRAKIIDGEIVNAHIANGAIDNAKIQDATIGTAKIELGAITTALIAESAIESAQIADGSITDAKIVELTANKITAGLLSVERLRIVGPDSILYELNVNSVGELAASELTLDGAGITERSITADRIVAEAITAAEIAARTITANHLVTNTIKADSGVIADLAITNAMIANATITAAKIADATITNAKIANATIESAKIKDLDASKLTAGSIIANNITIKGKLDGATGTFSGDVSAANLYISGTTGTSHLDTALTFNYSQAVTRGFPKFQVMFQGTNLPADMYIGMTDTYNRNGNVTRNLGQLWLYANNVLVQGDISANRLWGTTPTNQPHTLDGGIDIYQGKINLRGTGSPGIEITSTNGGNPYIDFSNDDTIDYDARIRLSNNDLLEIIGAGLWINGVTTVNSTLSVIGAATFDAKITGKSKIESQSVGESMAISVPTVTQQGYLSFYSGGTRRGYVGIGATTNNDLYLVSDSGSIQFGSSSHINNSGGTPRWAYDSSNYILQIAGGTIRFYMGGVVKHSFQPDGAKSGGSIEVDGVTLGMSPIDSPQLLLEYIEFDIPLSATGTKVFIDEIYLKTVENFALWPNKGEIVEKGKDYFIIKGHGVADVRIVGERVGYKNAFYADLEGMTDEWTDGRLVGPA